MLPLTRPSTPTPCLWHPKGHKQSPGFFHFLLRVCAYSTPDLGALSPIPRQDLSAGSDNLFSLHYLTLGAPAFSWSISISISVKVLEFPYSSLHSGCCMSSNQGLFLWPSLVCLPQPHMGSDILHIVAFVRNINFWYLRQGDRISPFMFYCFRKGKKGVYLFIYFCVNWTGYFYPFPSVASGLPVWRMIPECFTSSFSLRGLHAQIYKTHELCQLSKCLELPSQSLNVSDNLSRLKATAGLLSVNKKELWQIHQLRLYLKF